jgi:hypothetical protein
MSQSRAHSAVEAVANVAIGYGVAVASQIVILPMFGVHLPLADNLAIGAWFTAISLVRSYAVRRLFNAAAVNVKK